MDDIVFERVVGFFIIVLKELFKFVFIFFVRCGWLGFFGVEVKLEIIF